jgi:hypothetical protein
LQAVVPVLFGTALLIQLPGVDQLPLPGFTQDTPMVLASAAVVKRGVNISNPHTLII